MVTKSVSQLIPEAKKAPEVTALDEQRVQELGEIFAAYDVEGEGKLTFKSFEHVMKESWEEQPAEGEIEAIFNEADRNNKGYLTFADFVNWLLVSCRCTC